MQWPVLNIYDISRMKATIYPIDSAAPNRVAIVARPRGGDWLRDELSALSMEGIDVLVSMLTEEESKELGLEREGGGLRGRCDQICKPSDS